MKLRTGPKVSQVSTGQLRREAGESKRNLAPEDDDMKELYSNDEMLMRGIYRGRDMFTTLPVPSKYALHWPTDDFPDGATPVGARRRSSATNSQMKMEYGLIDLYLMRGNTYKFVVQCFLAFVSFSLLLMLDIQFL